ncbi:MAG: Wzy polymerase domain-containing protein [Burkholderiales bacterium]
MTHIPLSPAVRCSLLFAALLCVLPFLQPFHTAPLTSFYTEALAIGLGLGVLAVLLDRGAREAAEVPWITLLPFGLALLLLIHGVLGWSPYFGQALMGALYLAWAGVLIIAVRVLLRICGAETVCAVVAAGLAAGAVLGAVIGVIQHFNLATPLQDYITQPHSSAIFGNMGQPNHYAAYTTLGLFSLAYLHDRQRIALVVAIACAIPLLFVLGLSGSRSVWLYLLAAFALSAWLRAAPGRNGEGRRLFLACGALIIVHFALQWLVSAGWFRPSDRESVTAVERLFSGAASVTDRIGLWRAAWAIALENPLLGTGWGAFAARYYEFSALNAAPAGLYNNVHNIVLHFFAETGLVGVALLLLPPAIAAVSLVRANRDAHLWWLSATLAVIAIHSLLEYPLWYGYFLGIAALLLGLTPTAGFVPRLARLGHLFAAAVIGIGAFNTVFLWLDYRELEGIYRVTVKQDRKTDLANTVVRLHANTLLTPYVELAAAYPLAVDEQNLAWRLQLVERVVRFNPLPVLVYRQALLLALADRGAEARSRLAQALRVYPAVPAGFDRELARLAQHYPERFGPLLEFRSRRAPGRP